MITIAILRKLALAFPDTVEAPHFESVSFRVGKKIFATYDAKLNRATLKLSAVDQDAFAVAAKQIIFPVPNKWGKQGWTYVDLGNVHPDLFADALTTAYCEVAPQKLAKQVRPDGK